MPWFLPMLGKALLGGVVSAVAARAMRPKQTIEHRTTIQKTESKADLPAMVADSQKAGINPLTALRSGMGTAYGTNVTRTIVPPLASPTFLQSAVGGAIRGFGNFLTNMPTPYETEMRALRMQELKGNIAYTGALTKDLVNQVGKGTIPPTFAGLVGTGTTIGSGLPIGVNVTEKGTFSGDPVTSLFTHVTPEGNTVLRYYPPGAGVDEIVASLYHGFADTVEDTRLKMSDAKFAQFALDKIQKTITAGPITKNAQQNAFIRGMALAR